MLPELDKVKNLEECINFFEVYRMNLNFYDDTKNFGNDNLNNRWIEGMLYVQTHSNTDFSQHANIDLMGMKRQLEINREDNVEEKMKQFIIESENFKKKKREFLDNILNNPEKLSLAEQELTKRKIRNQEILKSYNLIKE
jgi:hypothetical protein